MVRSTRLDILRPPPGQTAYLRAQNTASVLYALMTSEHVSRRQLIDRTGLAPSTVSGITAELLERGIIRRVGNLGRASAGRKADLLSRNPKAGCLAAVHLTPEVCRLGIVDLGYSFLAQRELRFPDGFAESETPALTAGLRSLIAESSHPPGPIAVGLALPHHPFDNQLILDSFAASFPYPVVAMNNVEAMAMYEYYAHLRARLHTLAFIYIGTGIGSGLIINGNLYKGVTGQASDFGHTYITDAPLTCRCGRKGCLETVASELSLSRALAEHFGLDPTLTRNELIELLSGNIQKGDRFTLSLLERAAAGLGKAVFNLITILDPQEVIVTGRLNRLNPAFSNRVENAYLEHARHGSFPIVPLTFLALHDDAGLKGTAMFSFISLMCGMENKDGHETNTSSARRSL